MAFEGESHFSAPRQIDGMSPVAAELRSALAQGEQFPDSIVQFIGGEGFLQEQGRAGCAGVFRHHLVARDEEHWQRSAAISESLHHLVSIHPWHADIGDHRIEVRELVLVLLQCQQSVAGRCDLVSLVEEGLFDDLPDHLLVLDQQQAGDLGGFAAWFRYLW